MTSNGPARVSSTGDADTIELGDYLTPEAGPAAVAACSPVPAAVNDEGPPLFPLPTDGPYGRTEPPANGRRGGKRRPHRADNRAEG